MVTGRFYIGDVNDGCPSVEDASCDLIVTSPPYFTKNGYSDDLMVRLGEIFSRVLKPGGRAYVIIAQIKEKLDRPFDAQQAIIKGGRGQIVAGQTIIWVKSIAVGGWTERCPSCDHSFKTEIVSRGHFQPISSNHLLNYCWEDILAFVKEPASDAPSLNRRAIGVAYADKSNIKRWKSGNSLHCPGDVWFLPYETTGSSVKKTHRHEFPMELARRLIVMSGIRKGSVVFDPFIGGGTTALAANECGMNAIGYDMCEAVIDRLTAEWATVDSSQVGSVNGQSSTSVVDPADDQCASGSGVT